MAADVFYDIVVETSHGVVPYDIVLRGQRSFCSKVYWSCTGRPNSDRMVSNKMHFPRISFRRWLSRNKVNSSAALPDYEVAWD